MRRTAAVLLAVALVVPLGGCRVMQRISEGAYRTAVTDGATVELAARGVHLEHRPECAFPREAGPDTLTIRCTGSTVAGAPVEVSGVARDVRSARPREQYVVTVAGETVLRASCLGPGCGS
ncbi:hypothetical protein [Actinomadura flavalba]|uniref:hypothetical protein n=1 Tax=Actinomadura flavalba TaxID=1120938 RepID=UPI00036735D0|nr:hypothetical protein [Actinomadura flavalba]